MDPFSSTSFWRRLDAHIERRAQGVARSVRGLVVAAAGTGVRLAGTVMGRAAETFVDIEFMQHFGFVSVPPPATEVVTVPIGGSSAHRVVVAELDPLYRPKDLLPGEVAIYSMTGAKVHCKLDGSIMVSTPLGPAVECTAAGLVLLAGGGAPVARVGDTVSVLVSVTSADIDAPDPIVALGTITAGSTLVQAGG